MNDSSRPHIPLGSEAVSDRLIRHAAVSPAAFAVPARFLDFPNPQDLAMLSQVAAQVLEDPLAIQQLSDRVVDLLRQDLAIQQERSRGYGRRR